MYTGPPRNDKQLLRPLHNNLSKILFAIDDVFNGILRGQTEHNIKVGKTQITIQYLNGMLST